MGSGGFFVSGMLNFPLTCWCTSCHAMHRYTGVRGLATFMMHFAEIWDLIEYQEQGSVSTQRLFI